MESDVQIDRLQRALQAVQRTNRDLQRRLQELSYGPLAIVGMACRFPGGIRSPRDLWEVLISQECVVSEVPEDRWSLPDVYSPVPQQQGRSASRFGGFLAEIDSFDYEFFGISRREAEAMDPQHRLFLETSWEALEQAGCTKKSLGGSRTGVYATLSGADHAGIAMSDVASVSAYTGIGSAHSIGAGRLSYLLDLHGPNMVLDAACASSLVGLHAGCTSLRLRETDMVVCGAASTMLTPVGDIALSQLSQSFASDGETKTFAADADGFVRSEGVAVVVLKRLEDAETAGDPILAIIRGSGVNHDGRSAGLTAPNGAMQAALMRDVVTRSGVDANDVAFVETHGTGTIVGDPIEVEALRNVYGRSAGLPLYLGAVKTNLGHAEAAAGMAGLIKVMLCLEHGAIPPNRGDRKINPLLPLAGTTMQIPRTVTPWPNGARRRVAALSSFGLNGTNAHVLLEAAPVVTPSDRDDCDRRLLTLSARSPKALRKLARRYQDRLRDDNVNFVDEAFTASSRTPWEERVAVLASTRDEAIALLGDVVRGTSTSPSIWRGVATANPRPLAFLFPGMGSQYSGMGRELMENSPVFAQRLDLFDEMLHDLVQVSLKETLWPVDDTAGALLKQPQLASPALYALQVALAATWESWGIRPAAILGHSVGEYAAFTAAGVFTPEAGFELVLRRSELLAKLPMSGAMLGVNADLTQVADLLTDLPTDQISVAGINGPANVTVSGSTSAVDMARTRAEARGLRATMLNTAQAGHSPLVEAALPQLAELASQFPMRCPQVPLILGATGQMIPAGTEIPHDYLITQAREAVRFSDGVQALVEAGCNTFTEIGPGADALGMALDCLDPVTRPLMVPSLRGRRSADEAMYTALARLFTHGYNPTWDGVFEGSGARRVCAPTYPFDRVDLPRRRFATQPGSIVESLPPGGPNPQQGVGQAENLPAVGAHTTGIITRQELLDIPAISRQQTLLDSITVRLSQSLGFSSTIPVDAPLTSLGLDSLMAIELRNEISNKLGIEIDVTEFLRGTSLAELANTLVTQVESAQAEVPVAEKSGISPYAGIDDALLAELLTQVERPANPSTLEFPE